MAKKLKNLYSRIREKFIVQPKKQRNVIAFSVVIFFCLFLALIISAIDTAVYGNYFFIGSSLFFQDVGDAFMDFFNVNYFVQDMDPYLGSGSSYPPMVLLFAKIFQLIQGSAESAKVVQISARGIIALLLYFIIFFVGAWFLLRIYLKKNDISLFSSILIYFALLCSAPMLFAIDRGNYILYTFLLVGYFLLYYKSQKRWQRELSYLSLALAISFKIYPALFALLLLNKKDWRNLLKTALYSVILLVLPLFAFNGGFIENFKSFLENLLGFQSQINGYFVAGSDIWYLTGYYNTVSISGITEIVYSCISGISVSQISSLISNISNIFAAILAIVAVVAFYMTKKYWVKIFLLTSVMTFVLNTNYEYNLIFFIYPLLIFFMEDETIENNEKNKHNKVVKVICGILLTFIFIPLPMGYLIQKYSHSLQHGYPVLNLVQVVSYLVLTVILIVITMEKFCKRRSYNKKFKTEAD